MRVLVQKVPGFIFVFIALFPIILGVLRSRGFLDFEYPILLIAVPVINSTVCIWYLATNDYFKKEVHWEKKDFVPWVAGVLFLMGLVLFARPDLLFYLLTPLIVGYIYIAIQIIAKAEVLFNERSSWFLAMELIFPIYGMSTLTAEIWRWEKTKRNQF